MVLTLLLLAVLVTLTVVGVIRAFQGSYTVGTLALILAAGLFGPSLWRAANYSLRGIETEIVRDGGRIEVRNDGPIAFTHVSSPNRYGGRIHRFRTSVSTQDGPQPIGFSIWDIGEPFTPRYSSDCLRQPGPGGLEELFTSDEPVAATSALRCRGSSIQEHIYESVDGDGPRTRVRCTKRPMIKNCSMRIFHGPYRLNVAMWAVPPAEWRPVRDRVTAIIDQSFVIVEPK